jgi:hypothetical protein
MKHTLLLLPLLATLTLTSCVVPGDYPGYGASTVGVSYGTYAALPPAYVGDAYFYGGRYYYGGRHESGRYHDHGRAYTSRYYHNGRYYYGGRHEHHGGARPEYNTGTRPDYSAGTQPVNYGDPRRNEQYQTNDRQQPIWQSNRTGEPYTMRARGE